MVGPPPQFVKVLCERTSKFSPIRSYPVDSPRKSPSDIRTVPISCAHETRQAGRRRCIPRSLQASDAGPRARMKASGPGWTAPEAGYRLFLPPGGPNHEDGGSGRKIETPKRWMSGRERKKADGKPKNEPSKQNGHPEAKNPAGKPKSPSGWRNPGRDGKNAAGLPKRRPGKGKNALGSSQRAFFDNRSPSGGRYAGPSSWRVVSLRTE